ncbi:MAG: hypothetical protein H7Z74_13085 [Anaerolineae bacterium]|nr:hypothetical protein [Gemmatimonadaceae bacterium]
MTRYGVGMVVRLHFPNTVIDPDDASILAVVAAINSACAAKGISIELTQITYASATPGSGATICEDKAVMVVPDDSGEKHIFKLPAPKVGGSTIFEADNATLDKTDAAIIALSASLVTYGKGRSGDALTPILKGHRAGGKALKH